MYYAVSKSIGSVLPFFRFKINSFSKQNSEIEPKSSMKIQLTGYLSLERRSSAYFMTSAFFKHSTKSLKKWAQYKVLKKYTSECGLLTQESSINISNLFLASMKLVNHSGSSLFIFLQKVN